MPLSDHEQRLLEQMERALYAEDPRFASALRTGPTGRASRGRAALGAVGVLAGLGMLVGGVAGTIVAVSIAGFIVMLAGSVMIYSGLRPAAPQAADADGAPVAKSKAPKNGGFMDRLDERWRRRDEGNA